MCPGLKSVTESRFSNPYQFILELVILHVGFAVPIISLQLEMLGCILVFLR